MAKNGRGNKFIIDYGLVEKLANIQCTEIEIASVLGCDRKTLQRDEHFKEVFEKCREGGKASLRRIQWEHAKKSASMAMFLGKQYLGQRDNLEISDSKEISKLDEVLKEVKEKAGE